jgi:hypothetical protein
MSKIWERLWKRRSPMHTNRTEWLSDIFERFLRKFCLCCRTQNFPKGCGLRSFKQWSMSKTDHQLVLLGQRLHSRCCTKENQTYFSSEFLDA